MMLSTAPPILIDSQPAKNIDYRKIDNLCKLKGMGFSESTHTTADPRETKCKGGHLLQ